ncbi:pentatricopeptide repeat-containing protein At2g44880-like [Selaginella moellendorffii]|uniref:pentatricopeptide repeat-containing protein At2g44880-like n=1 Tax=Selaginella moellendorffii TaxID=88036 RepID=UPI000D1C57DB|nr:pentatricopeptide repeat-containing protein At2g44880-like [Selaginella moellendorffii]|eukprot:XP_024544007.1 pentatricopeptide repeat-containing protein At2g44880-like [Selaginella moellendorffii]
MPEWNMFSYSLMIKVLAQNRKLEEARNLFDQSLEKSIVLWNALISAHCQNGQILLARKLFDSMPERDLISWNAILAGLSQTSNPQHAFDLFHEMIFTETPDKTSFANILAACGSVFTARSFFHSMLSDFNIESTKIHFSAMINVLCQARYFSHARELMETMPFVPDSIDWMCLRKSLAS